ncbi:FAD-dependent oxidoreductase, partial [bacterium]|nr:FAD-dependent oxidoreductase [bacterium]
MTSPDLPPSVCDVLVVGAGPAGSACAQWLARHGWDVVLIDQHDFPRDKVCGDGLIPDAHHALQRLGVHAEVMDQAQAVAHVACIGARGGRVDVPGRVAVLPRKQLDDILKRAAERAGAHFFAPWRFEAPLLQGEGDDALVIGARLKSPTAGECEVRARWVVLATGAVPRALMAAGLCTRHTPSGVALRGYVQHPGMVGKILEDALVVLPELPRFAVIDKLPVLERARTLDAMSALDRAEFLEKTTELDRQAVMAKMDVVSRAQALDRMSLINRVASLEKLPLVEKTQTLEKMSPISRAECLGRFSPLS